MTGNTRVAACSIGLLTMSTFAQDVQSTWTGDGDLVTWSDPENWEHDPVLNTFPNNGNEGRNFDVHDFHNAIVALDREITLARMTMGAGSGIFGTGATLTIDSSLISLNPQGAAFTGQGGRLVSNVLEVGRQTMSPGGVFFGEGWTAEVEILFIDLASSVRLDDGATLRAERVTLQGSRVGSGGSNPAASFLETGRLEGANDGSPIGEIKVRTKVRDRITWFGGELRFIAPIGSPRLPFDIQAGTIAFGFSPGIIRFNGGAKFSDVMVSFGEPDCLFELVDAPFDFQGGLVQTSGTGEIRQTGGASSVVNARLKCIEAAPYVMEGGALGDLGPVSNEDTFLWGGGRIGDFTNLDDLRTVSRGTEGRRVKDGQLVNKGRYVTSGGTLFVDSTGSICNDSDGRWLQNGGAIRAAGDPNDTQKFTNKGLFRKDLDGFVDVDLRFNNEVGTVVCSSGTLDFRQGRVEQIVGGVLVAGTWRASGNGRIRFLGESITAFGPNANVGVSNDNASIIGINGARRNDGRLEFDQGADVEFDEDFDNNGEIFDGESILADPATVTFRGALNNTGILTVLDNAILRSLVIIRQTEGVIRGDGGNYVAPAITVDGGVISPGEELEPIGSINLDGPTTLGPNAGVEMDIRSAGLMGFDQIFGTSGIALDGTLTLRLLDGFIPEIGDEVVLASLSGGEITGSFAQVIPPAELPAHVGVSLRQDATTLAVRFTCRADITGNGVLDGSDFFAYLDLFANGDPRADLTGEGTIDGADFFAYLDLFVLGCD